MAFSWAVWNRIFIASRTVSWAFSNLILLTSAFSSLSEALSIVDGAGVFVAMYDFPQDMSRLEDVVLVAVCLNVMGE
jgi:hypothetical protein